MTTTRTKVLAFLFLLAMGGIAAALILSATARADTTDDVYVSNLHSQGITSSGGDSSLIAAGHLVCQQRANGMSGLAIAYAIEDATNLRPYQAGYMVGAAEGAYCRSLYDGPPVNGGSPTTVT